MKPFLKNSLLFLFLIVLMSSCAEAVDIEDCVVDEPYGFFGGLWHGFIAPFSFILSIFMSDVAMYAVNNNGFVYDLGFVLGAGILFGGSGKASSR
ncbi:hypothetical protein [Algoriphagus sediminis]|uniref:Lipoprotein n=1 Tax=Algoriphagus sediminis TaxID=3057113 RepID=A0ABT7YIE1_9BACT|nr:hypothetical protein [Algoriphagus sediminis]MDN3205919.1 hypothetical protein [Algoriphagus sediminis]